MNKNMNMNNLNNCDFTCLRKKNIKKLKSLYKTQLSLYNKTYKKYLRFKFSNNRRLVRIADRSIKPQVVRANNRLNRILIELKNNIDETDKLLRQQKKLINKQNKQVVKKTHLLEKQKKKMYEKNKELISKNAQIDFSSNRNNYRKFTFFLVIILNILFAIILYRILSQKK